MNATTVTPSPVSASEVTAVIELVPDPPVYNGRHRYGCCATLDGWCAQCSVLKQIEHAAEARFLLRVTGHRPATHAGAS